MKILIATTSAHKLHEMKSLLEPKGFEIKGLADFPGIKEPIENGSTFMENSAIKSIYYSKISNILTIADDSGIEVDFMNGEPGIHSARFGGITASGEEKNALILEKLKGVPDDNRGANYTCAITVASKGVVIKKIEEKCFGQITTSPSGEKGFGYDPIFFFPAYNKTFAQISLAEKNKVSHRGKALTLLAKYLLKLREELT